MNKVSNTLGFSQKWDDKLNRLMNESVDTSISRYTIEFKLLNSVKKRCWWSLGALVTIKKYDTYYVWVSNEDTHYGFLQRYNDSFIPVYEQYSVKQATLDKLAALEHELRCPTIHKAYN
ncbi:MAG: hypothetical protein GY820_05950 [Gammaproteobacteria bacterium]|nr:hypothetical protein [Gammaproteobacteria bacterium]